jgi:hypothetical protein
MLQRTLTSVLVASVLLLPACAHRTAWHLKPYHAEKKKVQLSVKPINDQESKEAFGRKMEKRGYYPFQLVVENHGDSYFILQPWQIGVPLASPGRVAKRLHHKTMLIATSMFMVGILGIEWFHPLSYASLLALPVAGVLSARNKSISRRVVTDAIDRGFDTIVIPPYGSMSRHFYIAEHNMSPQFAITLINTRDNQPVQFDVVLTETSSQSIG